MFEEEVKAILTARIKLHPNDPAVEKYWDKLIEVLSRDESKTITHLDNCDEEEALWISEVYEEVAYNLKSEKYIECLERINKKFPAANLEYSVQTARDYHLAALEKDE